MKSTKKLTHKDFEKIVSVMKFHETLQNQEITEIIKDLELPKNSTRTDIAFEIIEDALMRLAQSKFLGEHLNPQMQEMTYEEEGPAGKIVKFNYDKLPDGSVNLEKRTKESKSLNPESAEILRKNLTRIAQSLANLRLQSREGKEVELTLQPLNSELDRVRFSIERAKAFLGFLLINIRKKFRMIDPKFNLDQFEILEILEEKKNPPKAIKLKIGNDRYEYYSPKEILEFNVFMESKLITSKYRTIWKELLQLRKANQKGKQKKQNKFFYSKRKQVKKKNRYPQKKV